MLALLGIPVLPVNGKSRKARYSEPELGSIPVNTLCTEDDMPCVTVYVLDGVSAMSPSKLESL
jgi:hypothetical protein